MTSQQRVVAITGSSGHLGSKLLEHLEDVPGLGRLIAFDTRPLRRPVHNISAFRRDVTESIQGELDRFGVTTVLHLAFQWRHGLRRREAAELSEQNRKMLEEVIHSAVGAGVEHIIYISSHTVYGPGPDCPTPLNEDRPLPSGSAYPYATDNLRAEELLQRLVDDHPEMKVTILRCCPALGVNTSIDLLREFYLPSWLGLSDYNPPLQFVSDEDLARILGIAIREQHSGVFNVAADGVVFLREFAAELPARRIQMPSAIAYPMKRLTGGAYVAYSHYLDRWPVIMSTAKLKQVTGYKFRLTALEALASLLSYNEEFQEYLPRIREVR